MENELAALSNELAGAVEQAGRAVVAVNARPRFASSGVLWRPGIDRHRRAHHPPPRGNRHHPARRPHHFGHARGPRCRHRSGRAEAGRKRYARGHVRCRRNAEAGPGGAGHRPLARFRSQRHHGDHERGQRAVALLARRPDRPISAARSHAISRQFRRRRSGYRRPRAGHRHQRALAYRRTGGACLHRQPRGR